MKILFLDWDGVLILSPSQTGTFDKQASINLEFLLNKVPDLDIVISSEWRKKGLEAVKDISKSNGIDPRRILDITGDEQSEDSDNHRGYQIQCWLDRHPEIKNFAILDDKDDFGILKNKLVRTNKRSGLTQGKVEKVIEILEKNHNEQK